MDKTATEFPIYGDGLYAIRNTNSIDVRVDNSVFLTCTILLDLCLIEISGFYYNKVYGLLGSMTTETFMDFTMPDMNVNMLYFHCKLSHYCWALKKNINKNEKRQKFLI